MISREEFEELTEEEQEEMVLDAIAKVHDKADGKIYESGSAYFVVTEDEIYEIPSTTNETPKGGYLELFRGPDRAKAEAAEELMEQFGIEPTFFKDIYDYPEDVDLDSEEETLDNFDIEDEDEARNAKIIRDMQTLIQEGECPFDSVNEIAEIFPIYDLDPDSLYYEWEGEYIEALDNIYETGEPRGTYSDNDDYDWLEILENLDNYLVETDN